MTGSGFPTLYVYGSRSDRRAYVPEPRHMKCYSVRLSDAELAAIRGYAAAHQLPLSTALKRLAFAGLQAQQPAASADRPLLEQSLSLLRLLSALAYAQHHRAWLQDEPIGSSQRRWAQALALTNATLDRDPALFGAIRFPTPPRS